MTETDPYKALGFADELDLSTPERQKAFKRWQHDDGSREALAKLPTLARP